MREHNLAERTEHGVREFGHQGTHREQGREAMGLASFAQIRFSWVDVKVGLRMLRKHPMLNLAAIFAGADRAGAAIGLPIAARFVFELTGTPDGGGSVAQSMVVALGLSTGIVVAVGLGSCLVPARRILAIQACEAMHADG